jgi:hypothetical protein
MLIKEKRSKKEKEKVLITRITRRELFPVINTSSSSLIQLRNKEKWY